jgi:FlgD Ig-like domain
MLRAAFRESMIAGETMTALASTRFRSSFARPLLLALAAVVLLLGLPAQAKATWPPQGLPICTASGDQIPKLALEIPRWSAYCGCFSIPIPSAMLLVWEDHRAEGASGSDLFMQMVDEDQTQRWTNGGSPLATGPGRQCEPVAARFGSTGRPSDLEWEGLGIAYVDEPPSSPRRIVLKDYGIWSTGGGSGCGPESTVVAIEPVSGSLRMAGASSIVLGWIGTADQRIHLQSFNGCLGVEWGAGGVSVGPAAGSQGSMFLVDDGASFGFFVLWQQAMAGSPDSSFDLRLQNLTWTGNVAPGWPAPGLVLATAGSGASTRLPCYLGQSGGAPITVWIERSTGKLFAQTFRWNGAQFEANVPVPLVLASGTRDFVAAYIDEDYFSPHQLYVTWKDQRAGDADVYAQRLSLGTLAVAWGADGVAVAEGPGDQIPSSIVGLPSGGAMVAWTDAASGTDRALAMKVREDGVLDPTWPVGGRLLSDAPGARREPRLISNGFDGALVAWTDARDAATQGEDIYAQTIGASGELTAGVPTHAPLSIQLEPAQPNPSRGAVSFRLVLPHESDVHAAVYDVAGREIARLIDGTGQSGASSIQWDGRDASGARVPAGLHLMRVKVDGVALTRPFILLH